MIFSKVSNGSFVHYMLLLFLIFLANLLVLRLLVPVVSSSLASLLSPFCFTFFGS